MLNLNRYTETVNPAFSYALTIDYLVGKGLKTTTLNMTFFRESLKLNSLKLFEGPEQWKNYQVVFIPNGFSQLDLTGNVHIGQAEGNSIHLLNYRDPTGVNGNFNSMGWGLNSKFILYRVAFLPKNTITSSVSLKLMGFSGSQSAEASFFMPPDSYMLRQTDNCEYF